MRIFEDLFVVEVLDDSGAPVVDGQVGEIAITDLTNLAMPLIRYRVGGLGWLSLKPCECGRSTNRLQVEGRIQDALRDSSGQWVTSHRIAQRFYSEPWIDEFQLVEQNADLLTLTIVPCPGAALDERAARLIITDLLKRDVNLNVRRSSTISPEPGGKFRLVKASPSTKPIEFSSHSRVTQSA